MRQVIRKYKNHYVVEHVDLFPEYIICDNYDEKDETYDLIEVSLHYEEAIEKFNEIKAA
ncbi:MAG: hypothetical protein LUG21_04545 [Clostridiales bacterium]|nr:hypothetical protein [Clostridiales bacterium]